MPIDIELNAGRGAAVLLGVGVLLGCTVAYVGKGKEPLSKIPVEQREPLQKRLDALRPSISGTQVGEAV